MPRVEREEFINVGVILYCKGLNFLQTKFIVDEDKIKLFFPGSDTKELRSHLIAMQKIGEGDPACGPIASLDIASRFRWLTAKRSTIVQTSMVHPGFCIDAKETLKKLYEQLVL